MYNSQKSTDIAVSSVEVQQQQQASVAPANAYVVSPSHPLYPYESSTALLDTLPTAIAQQLRLKARVLSDVLLVHMLGVMGDPVANAVAQLTRPDDAAMTLYIVAAIDEEIGRRYRAGILAPAFEQGGAASLAYLESPEAQAEIEAWMNLQRANRERAGATLN